MVPLYAIILFPIIFGGLVFLISGQYARYISLVFQLLLVIASIFNFIQLRASQNFVYMEHLGGWSSTIGISLKLDLTAAVLVILTTVLFTAMLIFDIKSPHVERLFLMLFLFLEGMTIAIFVSHDFFNVFVLYEVATVVVSILIMFRKDNQSIYDGMIYLLTNLVAMVFFLFGTAILYRMLGVLDFALMQERMYLLQDTKSLILPYAFILTALSLKTALMPLFSWLPRAHATPSAPSIVSGILSGLFVKNGVYLLLRIKNIFDPFIDVSNLFVFLGFLTSVVGFILAISQKDIKLILAYSTVSQIGLIVMGLNMNNNQAFWGAVYHIINHAIFKSVLFLTAGIISKIYGTRNIYEIRGALKSIPAVSTAAILAILGITGAPFFNGSMSKYWISYGAKDSILEMGIIVINIGTVIYFTKFSNMFWGQPPKLSAAISHVQTATVMALGFMCLIGGIFAKEFISILFNQYLWVDPISYMEKTGVFIFSLIAGSLIYYKVIERYKLLNKVRSFELSFNDICLVIFLFFSFVFIYLKTNV